LLLDRRKHSPTLRRAPHRRCPFRASTIRHAAFVFSLRLSFGRDAKNFVEALLRILELTPRRPPFSCSERTRKIVTAIGSTLLFFGGSVSSSLQVWAGPHSQRLQRQRTERSEEQRDAARFIINCSAAPQRFVLCSRISALPDNDRDVCTLRRVRFVALIPFDISDPTSAACSSFDRGTPVDARGSVEITLRVRESLRDPRSAFEVVWILIDGAEKSGACLVFIPSRFACVPSRRARRSAVNHQTQPRLC